MLLATEVCLQYVPNRYFYILNVYASVYVYLKSVDRKVVCDCTQEKIQEISEFCSRGINVAQIVKETSSGPHSVCK